MMKKIRGTSKKEVVVFKLFEITTAQKKQFLIELQRLCLKYSVKDNFNFRFEIEN
jgi:hypothetical protein